MISAKAAPLPAYGKPRLTGLDALRGYACFMVLLAHCVFAAPPALLDPMVKSPWIYALRLVANGQAAVILFFWLSGFVLALPFMHGTPPSYFGFLIKRFCRLYIPFAAAVALAAFAYRCFGVKPDLAQINPLLNLQYEHLRKIWLAGHFLMIGRSQDIDLDIVTWTLVHEMRISLIFPLLIVLCRYRGWAIAGAVSVFFVAHSWLMREGAIEPWTVDRFGVSMLWTLSFVPHFIGGILLCRYSECIRSFLRGTSVWSRLAFFAAAVALFALPQNFLLFSLTLLYGLSAAVIMMVVLDDASLGRLCDARLLQAMGRVSYSVYLVHVPVLLVTGRLMAKNYPYPLLGSIALLTSLLVAVVFHLLVERPSMKLGQRLVLQSNTALQTKKYGLKIPKSPKISP